MMYSWCGILQITRANEFCACWSRCNWYCQCVNEKAIVIVPFWSSDGCSNNSSRLYGKIVANLSKSANFYKATLTHLIFMLMKRWLTLSQRPRLWSFSDRWTAVSLMFSVTSLFTLASCCLVLNKRNSVFRGYRDRLLVSSQC